MSLLDELISKFRSGDIVTRLVFINCAVFLAMLLMDINFTLFSFGEDRYAYIVCNYPWSPYLLIRRPWSIVTSLFASWGLWHLIFNMIILYWLGNVFMRYFTSNNLRGLYILGRSIHALPLASAQGLDRQHPALLGLHTGLLHCAGFPCARHLRAHTAHRPSQD